MMIARQTASSQWTVLVDGEETGGRVAVVELRARRGIERPRHVHSREDELVYVLEGWVTIELDGEPFERSAGTSLFMPRGSEHAIAVESDEARLLLVLSPAGLEGCFRELGRLDGAIASDQRIEWLVTALARYGVAITGPGRRAAAAAVAVADREG